MPNTDLINSAATDLNRAYTKPGELHLPVLQEQFTVIKKSQRSLDKALRDLLVMVPVDLQIDSIKSLLHRVTSVGDAAAENIYSAELAAVIDSSQEAVSVKVADFNESLSLLKVAEQLDVRHTLEGNKQLIKIQQTALQALEKAVSDVTAQKEKLDSAMRVLEDKSLWDEWKPLVAAIAKFDPRNPAISALRGAVTGVATILSIADEAVKYEHLVKARTALQEQLNGHVVNIKTHESRIQTLTLQNEKLTNFQAVEAHKSVYIEEVSKIADTLSLFLSVNVSPSEQDVRERARFLLLHSETLSRYLKEIRLKLK
jgi:hypothetical protein